MPGAYAEGSKPPRQSIGRISGFVGSSRARVLASSWETSFKSPSMLSWSFSPNRATANKGESVGTGGMGEVHRATDGRLGCDVAVKVLPEAKHAPHAHETGSPRSCSGSLA